MKKKHTKISWLKKVWVETTKKLLRRTDLFAILRNALQESDEDVGINVVCLFIACCVTPYRYLELKGVLQAKHLYWTYYTTT